MMPPIAPSVADDIATIGRIDAIPSILEIACRITGLRFAAVARVTETSWTACAVRDELAFGLAVGGELELRTTICDEIRCSGEAVIIDHVAEDRLFREHPTPRLYGFESYISIPIVRTDGTFFGTLCALDPLPAKVSDPAIVATFRNFAELIALQLDAQDQLAFSKAALLDAGHQAELREQFIAILGHDLRNPVAAIEAGTTLLAKQSLAPRAATIVGHMQSSCRRIFGLIDNLLDFARGRLGDGLVVTRRPCPDLALTLEQVVAELRAVHPARTVTATMALDECVTCDPARIGQLLSNLLANALTHGAADRPVTVAATSGGGAFTLAVANPGAPISQDAIARLFQPFTRAAGDRGPEGLGLGLYIASEIARAHDGRIDVRSDDTLTCFTLTMPSGS